MASGEVSLTPDVGVVSPWFLIGMLQAVLIQGRVIDMAEWNQVMVHANGAPE